MQIISKTSACQRECAQKHPENLSTQRRKKVLTHSLKTYKKTHLDLKTFLRLLQREKKDS